MGVKLNNISAMYQEGLVLNNISMSLEPGKIYGLLGPNGSGKSTLMNVLGGLKTPSSGEVSIFGKEIGVESKKITSYMTDVIYFSPSMTPKDIEELFHEFFTDFNEEKFQRLLHDFDIPQSDKVENNSKGTNQKLQFITTISREAKFYLFDEPFDGMDVVSRDRILKDIINEFSEDSILLISTHYLGEIESILDYVFFIDEGKIVKEGEVEVLRDQEEKGLTEIFKEMFGDESTKI
ncbi:MAG: ABC transporter ATP-binding protein [Tissierellia bacterium]|nr:ABC transporter ATP-binding protein [Tissierellia bacterium]